jgi:HEAT repeat protein
VAEPLTPEGVAAEFLSTIDDAPEREARRVARWREVRDRPELLAILTEIATGPTWPELVRRNAILAIGGTGQPEAFAFLQRLLAELPAGHPHRVNAVLRLGSGPGPWSAPVLATLESTLQGGPGSNVSEQIAAVHALSSTRTPAAAAILRAQLRRGAPEPVRNAILRKLPDMERAPGRDDGA